MKILIQDLAHRCGDTYSCETGEFLSTILNHLPDAVFVTDMSGNITYSGSGAEEMLGYSQKEIASFGNIFKLFGDRFFDFKKLREGVETEIKEYTITDKNKTSRILRIYISRIKNSSPNILVICQDITERKQAERAFEISHTELIRSQVILRRKNQALKGILNQAEEDRSRQKIILMRNLQNAIFPIMKNMREQSGQSDLLDLLESSLSEILSPFLSNLNEQNANLSPRELEVCGMIKSGFTSKDIANSLGISPQTVFKQRKNIRKKLKLSNKKANLVSYLNSIPS